MCACVVQWCLQIKKGRSQRSRDLILGRATLPAAEGLVHLPAGLALTNDRTELEFERFDSFAPHSVCTGYLTTSQATQRLAAAPWSRRGACLNMAVTAFLDSFEWVRNQ